jgi:hydroxylamine reductase
MNMFCYQCQETSIERGCLYFGACGKTEVTANYQDLLIYVLRGIAYCAAPSAAQGTVDREAGQFICHALFSTITNTNFDPERFVAMIHEGIALRDRLRVQLPDALPAPLPDSVTWNPEDARAIDLKSLKIDIRDMKDLDRRSIRELATYGMKGAAAYAVHAAVLGFHDDAIYAFLIRSLASLNQSQTEEELEQMALETGKIMIAAMALLDHANVEAYGVPEITNIALGTRQNPGILVTGHDLKDLGELLEQTVDSGVDVYTHSEMWAAHQYPFLKKYPNLAGNYGDAWYLQDLEFASFNGPILVTSNCIIPVAPTYRDRIYTTGVAGYPGIPHIVDAPPGQSKDFSRLIAQARSCAPPKPLDRGSAVGGFSHHAVAPILDQVVAAVTSGKIKKFVVMGGCDGRDSQREYYTQMALAALGVRGIRIGPTLPAFLNSDGGRRFMRKYDIVATRTVESDLRAICAIG